MATSTIPTIKAALVTRFAADTDLSSVQCSYGNPYPTRSEEELIVVGNVTNDQEPSGLGSDIREERYDIEILVSVLRSARESQQTLETRAFVIAGHIEDSIIDWRTEASPFNSLDGWMSIGGIASNETVISDQSGTAKEREATVTITLAVVARK